MLDVGEKEHIKIIFLVKFEDLSRWTYAFEDMSCDILIKPFKISFTIFHSCIIIFTFKSQLQFFTLTLGLTHT